MNDKVEQLLLNLKQTNNEVFMTYIYSLSSAWLAAIITYLYNIYELKKSYSISESRATIALITTLMTVYMGRHITGPHHFGKRLRRRHHSKVSKKRH
jgi:hypothetical protein